jgi:hypothetical protein
MHLAHTLQSLNHKDPKEYVEDARTLIAEARGSGNRCCGSECFQKLTEAEVQEHLVDIETARSLGYQK